MTAQSQPSLGKEKPRTPMWPYRATAPRGRARGATRLQGGRASRSGSARGRPDTKIVLYRHGTLELVHDKAVADEVYRVPLLVVMAPTNKGYILDLAPGQSLIEFLLQRGYDVYMIDWMRQPTKSVT